ncbi:MAG: Gfo/Idh/MocA family oxidoreductase [Phycisphaeraceae bacterium]|nr:Gfo/Idh/MocA family oxidoreductase [Phycisphaeraceae bacterium]
MSATGTTTAARPAPAGQGRRLRAAVVGVGRMGRHHARVYAQMDGTDLVGVVDNNAERAETLAEQFKCRALHDVRQLLEAGVDVVSIAVPTSHHRAMAEPLLKAGVACLIEKPLAGDVAEAEAIKRAADASGAVLMVGHIERFNPIMRALRRETSGGQEIVPRFIEVSRVSPMTFRSVDTSVVMDMMIHDLDVVIMLMGGREPDEIQASGVAVITEHEDICNARLTWRLPTGVCVANITCSRLALKTERITRITGENAYVKIDYGAKTGTVIRRLANEVQMKEVRELLRQGADLTNLKWHELVNIEELQVDEGEPIVMEIQAFLDAVRTGRRPEVDASAGLANVRTAERIIEISRRERERHQV